MQNISFIAACSCHRVIISPFSSPLSPLCIFCLCVFLKKLARFFFSSSLGWYVKMFQTNLALEHQAVKKSLLNQ